MIFRKWLEKYCSDFFTHTKNHCSRCPTRKKIYIQNLCKYEIYSQKYISHVSSYPVKYIFHDKKLYVSHIGDAENRILKSVQKTKLTCLNFKKSHIAFLLINK